MSASGSEESPEASSLHWLGKLSSSGLESPTVSGLSLGVEVGSIMGLTSGCSSMVSSLAASWSMLFMFQAVVGGETGADSNAKDVPVLVYVGEVSEEDANLGEKLSFPYFQRSVVGSTAPL